MNEQPIQPTGEGAQPDVARQAVPGPGAQLAAHRQERGWTIEQVASQLNLAPRQVQAIENDDFKALPGMAVARGFVRAYAKLLKVDPAPFLATMSVEPALAQAAPGARRTVAAAPFSEPRFPGITDRRGLSGKHVVIAVMIVLIAAGIWAAKQNGYLSSVSEQIEGGLASLSGGSAETVKPAPSNGDVVAPPASPPITESSTTGTVVAEPVTQAPVMPPASEAAATAQAAAATGNDALVLTVRQDSWIEIKGSGNRTVLSRIVKAGETETVEIKEPLTVVIGNAAGVDATLRGTPVPVKGSGKSNVARLNLK